jgi:transcriptional repressor NrdR
MRCPRCTQEEHRVVDSRDAGDSVRRRRECLGCGHRFTTFERIEYALPVVVKKDGRRQAFNRDKLLAGLRLAARKRPVDDAQLDDAVSRVELALSQLGNEVGTAEIGALALEELRKLDDVAYLRFASVYHRMNSPEDFVDIIRPLLERAP